MKSCLHISKNANRQVRDAILISGSSRSGTTILGKLLHSFQGVEYAFEPPMLFSVIALIEEIPKKQWKLLYETYLYEDFFINAISGRSINCNRVDDSSIYSVKSAEDIELRLTRSLSKIQAEELCQDHIIAYKMPDVVPFLPKLFEYYPTMRIIIMRRDANETLNSILVKKWFANESENKNLIWPYRIHRGIQIPFWVKKRDSDRWVEMSELDRCAYYYIRVNQDVEALVNRIEVKYDQLLNTPFQVARKLADKLGLSFSDKTSEIIETIKPTQKKRELGLIEKVSAELADLVRYYSDSSEVGT